MVLRMRRSFLISAILIVMRNSAFKEFLVKNHNKKKGLNSQENSSDRRE